MAPLNIKKLDAGISIVVNTDTEVFIFKIIEKGSSEVLLQSKNFKNLQSVEFVGCEVEGKRKPDLIVFGSRLILRFSEIEGYWTFTSPKEFISSPIFSVTLIGDDWEWELWKD